MKYFGIIALIGLFFMSCKKEGCRDQNAYNYNHDAQKDNGSCKYYGLLEVKVIPKFNGQVMSMDSVYQNISGYRVKFSSLKFYTTNFNLLNSSDTVEANSVSLYDYSDSDVLFSEALRDGNYSEMQMNIGVDSVRNHSDPAAFPNENPLNIINASGMFWTWASGYIFVQIEGQYDTDSLSTGLPTTNFSYHLGKDAFLKMNTQQFSFSIAQGGTTTINYELNLDKFFYNDSDTLDINVNPIIHSASGQETITEMLATNFNSNLVLE